MTFHPNDPNLDRDRHPTVFQRDTDRTAMWGLGAVAALVLLGLVVWSFSGPPSNTAATNPDTNTGSVTRTEPATPPARTQARPPQAPVPTAPATPPAPAPATPPAQQ